MYRRVTSPVARSCGVVVLVTGGAGYIGAHVVRSLLSAGFTVTVVDDLSTGRAQVVPDDVPLSVCSVSDKPAMRAVFEEMSVTGVVHLAALKSVEESERDPARYFRENVGGMASLLEVCRDHKIEWFLLVHRGRVRHAGQRGCA